MGAEPVPFLLELKGGNGVWRGKGLSHAAALRIVFAWKCVRFSDVRGCAAVVWSGPWMTCIT